MGYGALSGRSSPRKGWNRHGQDIFQGPNARHIPPKLFACPVASYDPRGAVDCRGGGGASTEIVTCRRKVAAERSMFEVFVTLGRHVPGGNSSSRDPDLQDLLLG